MRSSLLTSPSSSLRLSLPSSASASSSTPSSSTPAIPAPAPASLVLGWAFARPHQLDRCSRLHRSLFGGAVVDFTLPAEKFFSYDHPAQARVAEELLQRLREEADVSRDSPPVPLLVHTFSVNGYTVYMHVAKMIAEGKGRPFQLKGAIFDSGPGPWTFRSNFFTPFGVDLGYRALDQKPNPWFPPFAFFFISAAIEGRGLFRSAREAMSLFQQFQENWKKYYPEYGSPMEHVMLDDSPHPLLFLYSKADSTIPATFLDAITELQRKSGRRVFAHNFVTSGHVEHLKLFPEIYEQKMSDFGRECLKD